MTTGSGWKSEEVISTVRILGEALDERHRQETKWGQQNHPWTLEDPFRIWWSGQMTESIAKSYVDNFANHGVLSYSDILMEEVCEALAAKTPEQAREELVQVIAVACAAIESIDRNGE